MNTVLLNSLTRVQTIVEFYKFTGLHVYAYRLKKTVLIQ